MKLWMRLAAVGATALVFAGLLAGRPGGRLGRAEESDKGPTRQAPEPVLEVLDARNCVKKWITHELIAGRLTLHEAAAAFKDADAQGPEPTVMAAFPRSSSPDEAYCRSVISYVHNWAPPKRAAGMC